MVQSLIERIDYDGARGTVATLPFREGSQTANPGTKAPRVVLPDHSSFHRVQPELYCQIRYRGWTRHGCLRHAVFGGWIDDIR
jgi:hypothetical protein